MPDMVIILCIHCVVLWYCVDHFRTRLIIIFERGYMIHFLFGHTDCYYQPMRWNDILFSKGKVNLTYNDTCESDAFHSETRGRQTKVIIITYRYNVTRSADKKSVRTTEDSGITKLVHNNIIYIIQDGSPSILIPNFRFRDDRQMYFILLIIHFLKF